MLLLCASKSVLCESHSNKASPYYWIAFGLLYINHLKQNFKLIFVQIQVNPGVLLQSWQSA